MPFVYCSKQLFCGIVHCVHRTSKADRDHGWSKLQHNFVNAIHCFQHDQHRKLAPTPCRRCSAILEARSLHPVVPRHLGRPPSNRFSEGLRRTPRQAQHPACLAISAEGRQAQQQAHRNQQPRAVWVAVSLAAICQSLQQQPRFHRSAQPQHHNRKRKLAVLAACSTNLQRRRSRRPRPVRNKQAASGNRLSLVVPRHSSSPNSNPNNSPNHSSSKAYLWHNPQLAPADLRILITCSSAGANEMSVKTEVAILMNYPRCNWDWEILREKFATWALVGHLQIKLEMAYRTALRKLFPS